MGTYILSALVWAIFACIMNLKQHQNPSFSKQVQCFVFNFVGYPIAIIVAIIRTYKEWKPNSGKMKKVIVELELAIGAENVGISEDGMSKLIEASIPNEMGDFCIMKYSYRFEKCV